MVDHIFLNLMPLPLLFLLYLNFHFEMMDQAVLEKQSYMLIGRHDIEKLMRLDPASACLPNSFGQTKVNTNASDAKIAEFEMEMSDLLLNLRPIKQVLVL